MKREHRPFHPCEYEPKHVEALKRLMNGEAEPHQQELAFDWIVNIAGMVKDHAYFPGSEGDRDTAFACGRQFVARQILKLVTLPTGNMEQR